MKTRLTTILLASLCQVAFTQNVWLNEIHYDNAATDQGEFVEIALQNAGSYALSDFTITFYNGTYGTQYDARTLDSFTAGGTVEGITLYYLTFPENGIQNGEEDGIAISYQGAVVEGQFLSYEGVLTATDGPASGLTSTDIGVSESSATQVGWSLQLGGTGSMYSEFTWQEAQTATMGALNTNQTFGAFTPDPEPSGYPTDFAADPQGFDIVVSWTDATGSQLPHAYLIYAGDEAITAVPQDGTPVADDPDLSDGSGTFNVAFGTGSVTITGLESATTYYFKIFPYTNSGTSIDFKTDGTPPETDATTSNLTVILEQDFESESFGDWIAYSVTGEQVWEPYLFDNNWFARANGFSGGPLENDDWLISPALNLANYHNEILTFATAANYTGPVLQVKVSTDYAGSDNPNQATWVALEPALSPGGWTWTGSGQVDISAYDGNQVYLAFQYTSTTTEASTWEVDDIKVVGEANVGMADPVPAIDMKVYPNPSNGLITLDLPQGNYEAVLFSLQGKILCRYELSGQTHTLNLNFVPKGFYFLHVIDPENGTTVVRKVSIE
ncbi:MAG TPA: choice-of-anchor J domain-containing protein [Bacteroidales bacterium]|nr:choice-of-anchor J domain-containing protein [Bacteroidales bacterium]HNS46803.1 choice-of-anchor J domain-containing protein [Bacteroidales bacterium]